MKVICFGDSNTAGFDPRSYLGSIYDRHWVDMLTDATGWNVVNWGLNGREIPDYAVTFPEETDLLIIMLGTNDLLQGANAEQAACKMAHFIEKIPIPRDKLLLISPVALLYGEWVAEQKLIDESRKLADAYGAVAKEQGICFADASKWKIPLAFDGVHFTEEGHRKFAFCLISFLNSNMLKNNV